MTDTRATREGERRRVGTARAGEEDALPVLDEGRPRARDGGVDRGEEGLGAEGVGGVHGRMYRCSKGERTAQAPLSRRRGGA